MAKDQGIQQRRTFVKEVKSLRLACRHFRQVKRHSKAKKALKRLRTIAGILLRELLALAKSANKHVLIDFYADWCTDCVKMEKTTFSTESVISNLKKDFLLLKVDLTDPESTGGR